MGGNRFYWFLLSSWLFILPAGMLAQGNKLSINTGIPRNLNICSGSDTTRVTVYNISSSTISNVKVTLSLPSGVFYVPGTASGTGVSESNISDLNNPVFSAPTMGVGQRFTFSYRLRSNCDLLSFLNASGVPVIQARVDYLGSFDAATSVSFSVNLPSPGFASISNQSFSGNVGDRFVRGFTVRNFGKGPLSSLRIVRIHGSDVRCYGSMGGTTTIKGDTVITLIDASFIKTIGDKDTLLEQNEGFVLSDSMEVLACSRLSTAVEMSWGCDGLICQTVKSNGAVTINGRAPNIAFLATPSLNTCYDGKSVSKQMLRVFNRGQMAATDVFIEIAQSNGTGFVNGLYSRVDTGSIRVRMRYNGTPFKPRVDSIRMNSLPASTNCFGPPQPGMFRFNAGTLKPGDTLYLEWDMYTCVPTNCNVAFWSLGWQYRSSYTDQCKRNITSSWTYGYAPTWSGSSMSAFTPTDIVKTETKLFRYQIASNSFLVSHSSARYRVDLVLPVGLSHSLSTNDIYFENANLTATWKPDSVRQIGDTVRAFFRHPAPFSLNNGELLIYLKADCAKASGNSNKSLSVSFLYNPNFSCHPGLWLRNFCTTTQVRLHCGSACNGGMLFRNFSVARTSYGLPDNDNNGKPDTSGTIDKTKIRAERAMFGDTITSVFYGKVQRSSSSFLWRFGYAESVVSYGSVLDVVGVHLEVYKGRSKISGNCNRVRWRKTVSGLNATFRFDFTIDSIATGGCFAPTYLYSHNDSVKLVVRYRVAKNIGNTIYPTRFDNRFYFGSVPNPNNSQSFQCDSFSGIVMVTGSFYVNWAPGTYNVNNCNQLYISQNFYLSIGPCCSNYAGGNHFPFEYRSWSKLKAVRLYLPTGATLVRGQIGQYRTAGTNASVLERYDTLQASKGAINPIVFDIGKLYSDSGGRLFPSDDGFYGYFQALIQPGCDLSTAGAQPVHYDFIMERQGNLGKGFDTVNSKVPAYNDFLQFNKPALSLQATIPTVYAYEDTAEWELRYTNPSTSFTALNVWLSPQTGGSIRVVEIRDAVRDTVIKPVNGIYRAGALGLNQSRRFKVRAVYTSCARDSIRIFAGWNCTGYPQSFTDYKCSPNETTLFLEPQNTRLQLALSDSITIADLCAETPYRILLENIQATTAYQPKIQINLPPGLEVVPGSVSLKYPMKSSWTGIPTPKLLSGITYQWDLAALSSLFASGFSGTTDTSKNKMLVSFRVRTTCDYASGSYLKVHASASLRCGDPVPVIPVVSYPLDIKNAVRPYFTQVRMWSDSILPCEKPGNMRVRVLVLGPDTTATEDKFQILFPKGMVYDTSSLNRIRNGPQKVNLRNINGAQEVEWSLPTSIKPGDSIEFSFRYQTDGSYFGCGPQDLYGQSVVRQEVVCVKDNSKCKINVITGSTNITPPLAKSQPGFVMRSISTQQFHNDSEQVQLHYDIQNLGVWSSANKPAVLRYHYDADGSGTVNAGDPLLGRDTLKGSFPANAVRTVKRTLRVRAGYSCALIAVLDSASCACTFRQLRFPTPALANAGPDQRICEGDSLRLGTFANAGFKYLWEPAAAVDDETLARPRCLLVNQSGVSESYPLYLTTIRGLCISRDTVNVEVHPLPFVTARLADTSVCRGRPVSLAAVGFGSAPPIRYRWFPAAGLSDTSGAAVLARPASSTTYKVFAVDKNGCMRSDTSRVNMMPFPVSRFVWNFACEGQQLRVTDSSTLEEGSIVTRYWKLGTKDTLNGTEHAVDMKGMFTQAVRLISQSDAGCLDTFETAVDVKPRPRAQFTANPVCFGDSMLFVDQSTLSSGTLSPPVWLPGDGFTLSGGSVKHRYATTDTFLARLISSSVLGCSDTAAQEVVVYPRPVAAFSVQSVCLGDTLYFEDRSVLQGDVLQSHRWVIDGTSGYQNAKIAHRSSTEQFNRMYLHVRSSFGCADSLTDSVWVYPLPRPDFYVDSVCEGNYSRFRDSSVIPAGRIAKRLWDLADGSASTLIHPLHRYATGGIYLVKLMEESEQGCRDSILKDVVVHGAARPQISTSNHCHKEYGRFEGTYAGNGMPSNWIWHFGDGDSSLSQNQLYRYRTPGNYRVDLRIRTDRQCVYDTFTTVRVHALPRVAFGFTNKCYDNKLSFSDTISQAGGIVRSIRWNFGDGDTAAVGYPTHAYPSAGTWRVSLLAYSDRGCADSAVKTVATYDKVVVDFNADTVCFGNATGFKDASISPGAAISRYYWDFNDGRTSAAKDPTYTYKREGVYLVKHSISTSYNCQYDTVKRVVVHPMPIAGFTTLPDEGATVLNPAISFFDISSGADTLWYTTGDGNGYVKRDFVHRYADSGWYRAVQYAANKEGCADTFSKPVYISFIYTMYLPDAFTPNRDGKNEVFGPLGQGITAYDMKIYSRWGELIYQTQNSEPWDGTFRGSPVPSGVYVVLLNLEDYQGVRHWHQATFHLIR